MAAGDVFVICEICGVKTAVINTCADVCQRKREGWVIQPDQPYVQSMLDLFTGLRTYDTVICPECKKRRDKNETTNP